MNPMPDGSCRTIKSQYYKNSLGNFIRGGGYGATAVIEIVYESESLPPLQIWMEGGAYSQENRTLLWIPGVLAWASLLPIQDIRSR